MKRNLLKNLRIERVAIVRSPAHAGAEIVIAKSTSGTLAKIAPKPGETEDEYVARVMGDEQMRSEFHDEKQRAAVAHAKFRESVGKSSNGEKAMTPDEIKALNDKVAKAEATASEATKALERERKINALPDAERTLWKSLDVKAQDAFLALDDASRAVEVAKAKDADPVVYTSKSSGRTFRKSADPAMVEMAKALDTQADELAKAREREADAVYKSRATNELKHLPGDEQVRVDLLKAVDTIKDAPRREAALAALKAQNEQMAKAFERVGTSEPAPNSPKARLDSLIAKTRAADSKLSLADATAQVCSTPEGGALYTQLTAKATAA